MGVADDREPRGGWAEAQAALSGCPGRLVVGACTGAVAVHLAPFPLAQAESGALWPRVSSPCLEVVTLRAGDLPGPHFPAAGLGTDSWGTMIPR